ncbi:MAG: endolytic transglycosylase MltG [Synergistaceae bacterium]|nr:endolytic transglycosylase MltG [Synergistaceae bacterium]
MGRARRPQTKKRWIGPALFGASAFLVAVVLGAAFYFKVPKDLWEDLFPVPQDEDERSVSVLVEPGMNARQAARAFEEQDAVEGPAAQLAYWLVRLGADRRIKPGRYRVIRSSPWHVARQIRDMEPSLLKMTIVPGADVFSLPEALSGDVLVASNTEALHAAVMDDANWPKDMLAKLPEDEGARIAFLRPETYLVFERTPQEAVRAASASWWGRLGPRAAKLSSRELRRAAIIASMVEREVLHDVECRTVAGVIENRLKRGMPLQIDATVVYAWKLAGRTLTRVLNSDLAIESPYNTYRVSGLPPQPICVPGDAAWDAALDPEANGYYYYVAGKDGYHTFAATYEGHLRNVKRARSQP